MTIDVLWERCDARAALSHSVQTPAVVVMCDRCGDRQVIFNYSWLALYTVTSLLGNSDRMPCELYRITVAHGVFGFWRQSCSSSIPQDLLPMLPGWFCCNVSESYGKSKSPVDTQTLFLQLWCNHIPGSVKLALAASSKTLVYLRAVTSQKRVKKHDDMSGTQCLKPGCQNMFYCNENKWEHRRCRRSHAVCSN